MISERLFSRSYGSFWRDLLPFSDAFIRGVNAQWDTLAEEDARVDALERAALNEGAVRLYGRLVSGQKLTKQSVRDSAKEAAAWLGHPEMSISDYELIQVREMAELLLERYGVTDVVMAPIFRGCGIIAECKGDLLKGEALIEVKSGYRPFRISDFRQVITYLALNYSARTYQLSRIELFNARLLRSVEVSISDLFLQLAGDDAGEILARTIAFVSDGVVSGV